MTGSPVVHAFADESHRKGKYLICAVTVTTTELDQTRRELRALRMSGQRRLHFADEGDRRRRSLLSEMSKLTIQTHVFVADDRDQTASRQLIIRRMIPLLREQGVKRLVMDSRQGQDHKDRATIHGLVGSAPRPVFEYTHLPSASEPLLWVPDAVAWAYGRGGQWHQQIQALGLLGQVTVAEAP